VDRIDLFHDDILLEIFDFYVDMSPSYAYDGKKEVEVWQTLVHVCRRWRNVVLESPRRLNLQLYCTPKTPAKDTLDVWPALPLIIDGRIDSSSGTDNITAALGQSNRVCQVKLTLTSLQLEQVLPAMQVPFPELTRLQLWSDGEALPVVPNSFLDGSAPRLQFLQLVGVAFPGLPKLHLSATHLVDLNLYNIPHSGYFSPEAIVALISELSRLDWLTLEFQSPQSRPGRETRRPPSHRSVIPVLHYFRFKGVIEYLEDFVTGIDTPQLGDVRIIFFNQINFNTPQLAQFINRTPNLGKGDATLRFDDFFAGVGLSPGNLWIRILCREPDWQLSSIEQVCNSSLHPLSTVEDLYIERRYRQLVWKDDDIENTLWLQLLLPFTAVKNLYLSEEFAPGIAAALKELDGSRMTEELPSLQNIFVDGLGPSGPYQEDFGQFVAARELSDLPIAISLWDKD
jgi:hypothetical protein